MAKKTSKPLGKLQKKSSSKKKKGNIFTKIIVIIFVIILAFFLILSVFRPSGKTQKVEQTKVEQKVKVEEKKVEQKVEKKIEQKEEKPAAKEAKLSKKEEKAIAEKDKKDLETKAVAKSIKGTWQSTTGGAFLTMDGKEYRLDFMGVDSDKPIIGTYTVDGDMITFINTKDPCKDVKGLYEVRFNKQEIGFKLKSDDCTKRKATLPTEWTWLDTED